MKKTIITMMMALFVGGCIAQTKINVSYTSNSALVTPNANDTLFVKRASGGTIQKVKVSSINPSWLLTGNSGTIAGTNYIGTNDNIDFVFKTNGIERGRFLANGGMFELNETSGGFPVTTGSVQTNGLLRLDPAGKYVADMGVVQASTQNLYGLWIQSYTSATNLAAGSGIELNPMFGNVGIGTNTVSPTHKLTVVGGVKVDTITITDGTQGDGKVLTSNASGLGSWQTPVSFFAGVSTSSVTVTTGTVTIGSLYSQYSVTSYHGIAVSGDTISITLSGEFNVSSLTAGSYSFQLLLTDLNSRLGSYTAISDGKGIGIASNSTNAFVIDITENGLNVVFNAVSAVNQTGLYRYTVHALYYYNPA